MKLEKLLADGSFVQQMRALGIRRVELDADDILSAIELSDTIPAPSPMELWGPIADVPTEFPPPEDKQSGQCIATGCSEDNGWMGDRRYCRAHGLALAGVRK